MTNVIATSRPSARRPVGPAKLVTTATTATTARDVRDTTARYVTAGVAVTVASVVTAASAVDGPGIRQETQEPAERRTPTGHGRQVSTGRRR
ncbi:hypothetical protein [Actinacidiphila yeochonensis]|uniref:hypothetical protein n=1 Tax=Actinacidiphila yeochonensis TaxID=89050 RepID=UPI0012FF4F53|nr:hypothetical protein [Actinacidiphila yeochonensis]